MCNGRQFTLIQAGFFRADELPSFPPLRVTGRRAAIILVDAP
ncbi:hypothetical protein C4K35_5862 [Pseudomonas chlororaphis subsp. piscium]|nr:hypothetical protein C4K35_5862 [Pseudomonas chlororaphis subsp. piscium]AZC59706.1 hypothetical protein C4K34_5576 [Pseudomonas chlororaphis subsp. piscium]AZC65887.1 hypothetical protein C4K33_5430 [Pseudomonas chlororaphis subsp. piscium]AZC72113.1 hypothetical protein C4K32_5486 [Pseudomonas chlororaphis subsp. piscium]AZC78367.1 hypothetical protein C4K31_5499 [Pseudomonas chlororaphis subsp. piscium]